MAQARNVMHNMPGGQEMQMLDELLTHFCEFAPMDYDRQLSLTILEVLKPMLVDDDETPFSSTLTSFIDDNKEVLKVIYQEYADDERRSPLLFQPEAIAVFILFEQDRFTLKNVWDQMLPSELLQGLTEVWGAGSVGRVS